MIKRCTGRRLSGCVGSCARMICWSCRGARILLPRRRGRFVLKFCSILLFTYSDRCAWGRVSRRMDNSVLHPRHVIRGRASSLGGSRRSGHVAHAALRMSAVGRASGVLLDERRVVVVAVRPRKQPLQRLDDRVVAAPTRDIGAARQLWVLLYADSQHPLARHEQRVHLIHRVHVGVRAAPAREPIPPLPRLCRRRRDVECRCERLQRMGAGPLRGRQKRRQNSV